MILLDEPTAGMSRSEADAAVELIRAVSKDRTLRDRRARHERRVRARRPHLGARVRRDRRHRHAGARSARNEAVRAAYLGTALACLRCATCTRTTARATSCRACRSASATGEIVSLLGRNGAGRSTTVKTIMGEVPCRRRRSCSRASASTACRRTRSRGAASATCPRTARSFPTLTVRENLLLGMKRGRPAARWSIDDVFALFPQLRERADTPGGVLSGGEQQMLTICRTLMGDPDLIMVDEPTEGLAPQLVSRGARAARGDRRARRGDPADRAEAHDRARRSRTGST